MAPSATTLVRHVAMCDTCRPAFSFHSMCSQGQTLQVKIEMTERHHQIMIKGLRSNYLLALQRAIEDDPSIPMAPGECGWTPEACRVNRQQHGPCLDH
jgi:hypothetical protein